LPLIEFRVPGRSAVARREITMRHQLGRQAAPLAPTRRRGRRCALFAVAAVVPLVAAGCGSSSGGSASSDGAAAGSRPISQLKILVGTAPGGGFDLTARSGAQVAKQAQLARNVQVTNLAGAGGTIALNKLINDKGNGKQLQMMGLGVVGAVVSNKSKATLQDTTPIARLTQESDIIVVKADSKYKTLADLLADWKANPRKLPIGSGSAVGGPDHLATMFTAKAAGVDPKQVNHVSFDGGGELLTSVLGGQVAAGVTGVGEVTQQIEAGKLRALAVTGADRVNGVDAPTLKEAGLDAEMVNWRGLVAPPALSAADKQTLLDFAAKLHDSSEWKAALKSNGWTDAYIAGDEFKSFIDSENTRVAGVLTELGLGS
jgi:putative tricarboxylic transport membrane protein